MLKHSPLDLDQALPDQIPWGVLGGEDLEDQRSWFRTIIASLQGEDTSSDNLAPGDFVHPVRTSKASIGLIFGCIPPHTYKADDCFGSVFLSFALRAEGKRPWKSPTHRFEHTVFKSLRLSLATFSHPPNGPNPLRIEFLKVTAQKLIFKSKLRIIIMCGKELNRLY
jgi:hypothetical protein